MKLEFSPQIFKKYSNTKFNENPSSGSPNVPCGRTDGRTDMTKLIAALRNFANAPVNWLKTRNGNHNINKTSTSVLQSVHPSARWRQHMPCVTASQPGQATLDSLKASCSGDLRSTACVRQYNNRQVGGTDGLSNSWARRSVGPPPLTQLQTLILKTEIESFEKEIRTV
jgi:hypothetical protein